MPGSPLANGPSPFAWPQREQGPTPTPEPSAPRMEPARPSASEPTTPVPANAELFGSFAPAQSVPAPPSDRSADLFAAFDTSTGGEQVGPDPVGQAPFAPEPAVGPRRADGPPPFTGSPADGVPATPEPAAPFVPPTQVRSDSSEPTPAPAPPLRPAADVGAVDRSVTSAGLIRRTPKAPSPAPGLAPGSDRPRAAQQPAMGAGNRSPEEVRQMLSRYRAGLRHGRGSEEPPSPSNRRS